VALSGTALPIVCTIAVFPNLPGFGFKESLVAGTSLSSTAIGMATKMMQAEEAHGNRTVIALLTPAPTHSRR